MVGGTIGEMWATGSFRRHTLLETSQEMNVVGRCIIVVLVMVSVVVPVSVEGDPRAIPR